MKSIFTIFILIFSANLAAQPTTTSATEIYFAKIKHDPHQLTIFLQAMPKGGDLHNHSGGSSMAENMILYGKNDPLCVDPNTFTLTLNTHCIAADQLHNIPKNSKFYNAIIDAWSMRHFPATQLGHNHFFATFGKFDPIADKHDGEIIAEIVERAGQQNELYLELMVTPDNGAASQVGEKAGWDSNLTMLHKKLLAAGLTTVATNIAKQLDQDETVLNHKLHCNTRSANLGCQIKVRYLYQVLREEPPEQVFAQLLTGFILANQDPRVVGINMVQPEDGKLAMHDYKLHMQMVGFLHQLYPKVHISLHAGELIPKLVPAQGLRSHINDAVNIAHAERIGHGVDIFYEKNVDRLLKQMASKHIMVEINLTSNEKILGVKGKTHPLPLYLRYKVPVALSTDDEGVLRTNLTEEYKKAALTYGFSYSDLKNLSRNSITYSFLPGKTLWVDDQYQKLAPDCANDSVGSMHASVLCQSFLNANEKARLQWTLEQKFVEFEQRYAN